MILPKGIELCVSAVLHPNIQIPRDTKKSYTVTGNANQGLIAQASEHARWWVCVTWAHLDPLRVCTVSTEHPWQEHPARPLSTPETPSWPVAWQDTSIELSSERGHLHGNPEWSWLLLGNNQGSWPSGFKRRQTIEGQPGRQKNGNPICVFQMYCLRTSTAQIPWSLQVFLPVSTCIQWTCILSFLCSINTALLTVA